MWGRQGESAVHVDPKQKDSRENKLELPLEQYSRPAIEKSASSFVAGDLHAE